MTNLNKKTRIKIEPSTRDSISSWLDVLTSMLAVSDSQRAQVRDELEDHLRSRVDDLLIMGKAEPDAVQAAIQELDEIEFMITELTIRAQEQERCYGMLQSLVIDAEHDLLSNELN